MSGALNQNVMQRTFGGSAGTVDVLSSIRRMIALEGAGADAPRGPVDVLRLESPLALDADSAGDHALAARRADADRRAAMDVADVSAGSAYSDRGAIEASARAALSGPGDTGPTACDALAAGPTGADARVSLYTHSRSPAIPAAEGPPTHHAPLPAKDAGIAANAVRQTASLIAGDAEMPVAEGGSLITAMIRDVIRQELGADGSGDLAREMREMILREVARVLTAPAGPRAV